MGARHSNYKRLQEEHEFVPLSSWQKEQEKGEAAAEDKRTGRRGEQSERAKGKEGGGKK